MSTTTESGDQLRDIRKSRGLSIKDVAEQAGNLSQTTVRRVEGSPTPWDFLTVATMQGLAKGYGISLKHMFSLAIGDTRPVPEDTLSWARIPTKTDGDMFVPTTVFKPPQLTPDNVRAAKVKGDWFTTREMRYRVEAKPSTWLLTSEYLRARPGDAVIADGYSSDGTLVLTVLFEASESGSFHMCWPIEEDKHSGHDPFQLPSAVQGTETIDVDHIVHTWITRGPVVYFTR